jgi:hypothetical protein
MPLRASGPTVRGPIPGPAANVFFTFWCAYLYSTRQAGARCPSAFRLADLWILGLYIRSSCHVPGGIRSRDLQFYEQVASRVSYSWSRAHHATECPSTDPRRLPQCARW